MAESLARSKFGNHIARQIIYCGALPAPNYGEAQSAESRSDFIHKKKVVIKELRETRVWLLMKVKALLIKAACKLDPLTRENNELNWIYSTSIKTASQRTKQLHNSKIYGRHSIFILNSFLSFTHVDVQR